MCWRPPSPCSSEPAGQLPSSLFWTLVLGTMLLHVTLDESYTWGWSEGPRCHWSNSQRVPPGKMPGGLLQHPPASDPSGFLDGGSGEDPVVSMYTQGCPAVPPLSPPPSLPVRWVLLGSQHREGLPGPAFPPSPDPGTGVLCGLGADTSPRLGSPQWGHIEGLHRALQPALPSAPWRGRPGEGAWPSPELLLAASGAVPKRGQQKSGDHEACLQTPVCKATEVVLGRFSDPSGPDTGSGCSREPAFPPQGPSSLTGWGCRAALLPGHRHIAALPETYTPEVPVASARA